MNVKREVDLMEAGSNLVIFKTDVEFFVAGSHKQQYYYYAIAKDYEWSFAALDAFAYDPEHTLPQDRDDYKIQLRHERLLNGEFPKELLEANDPVVLEGKDNFLLFRLELPEFLQTKGGLVIVKEFHKGRREPYPKVIRVYEQQKVELFESMYYLSVYPTAKSTFFLRVDQKNIEYYNVDPSQISSKAIAYGPFQDLPPLSFKQFTLFFVMPYPLPYFSKATRDIFVSHWGNIAIDEYFYIMNEAAGINGQFSRVDYMPHINPNNGANAINAMSSTLPQYINGLYYHDYIGNISSSNAERKIDHVFFHIEPRFPIFGQWKTDWNQGYNMPTAFHLFQNSNNLKDHTLEVDFMHAYDKSLVEDYTVKVILPEGAYDIKVEVPEDFKLDSITMSKFFGTLDYFGRPQITMHKKDAVHELLDHNLKVHYKFDNSTTIYLEPVCMFVLIFSIFLMAIVYSRLGFDLEQDKKEKLN